MPTLNEPDPEEPTLRYLIELPGVFLNHSGTTLFHHLLGTYRVLRSWDCDEDLCVAGLYHSVYGTPAYRHAALPESRRGELRGIIGAVAEDLVYQFSRTHWPSVFGGGSAVVSILSRPLLTLAAANLVEQESRLPAVDEAGSRVRDSLEPFTLLVPHLSAPAARGLLESLHHATDAPHVPRGMD